MTLTAKQEEPRLRKPIEILRESSADLVGANPSGPRRFGAVPERVIRA